MSTESILSYNFIAWHFVSHISSCTGLPASPHTMTVNKSLHLSQEIRAVNISAATIAPVPRNLTERQVNGEGLLMFIFYKPRRHYNAL